MILKANTSLIKEQTEILNQLINEYEINSKSIYSNINQIFKYWKIPVSPIFYAKIEEYRKKDLELYELQNIISIYRKITNKYMPKYEKIYYNSDNDNRLNEEIKEILEELQDIVGKYNNINLQHIPDYREEINNQKNSILRIIDIINGISQDISSNKQNIKDNELEIKNELSKIDIIKMEEFEEVDYIMNYKSDTPTEVYVDDTGLENEVAGLISKLQIQEETINKISNSFNILFNNYISNNTNSIKEIIDIEQNNFKIILDNFAKYILIFRNAISNNNELRAKLQDIFDSKNTINSNIKTL